MDIDCGLLSLDLETECRVSAYQLMIAGLQVGKAETCENEKDCAYARNG